MMCGEFEGLYELYALGALEPEEREALREHLERHCEGCMGELERARERNAEILRAVPKFDPPAKLRTRVLAAFGIETRPWWWRAMPWTMAPVAVAAVLVAGFFYETRQARDLGQAATAVEFLASPGTRQVSFGTVGSAPRGSVLVQREKGLLLVVVNLPEAPAGKMYETWIVPKQGAPRPVGELLAGKGRERFALVPGPLEMRDVKAVAVSVERARSKPLAPAEVLFAAPVE